LISTRRLCGEFEPALQTLLTNSGEGAFHGPAPEKWDVGKDCRFPGLMVHRLAGFAGAPANIRSLNCPMVCRGWLAGAARDSPAVGGGLPQSLRLADGPFQSSGKYWLILPIPRKQHGHPT